MTSLMDYISLDKSWMIRVGLLDMINRFRDITEFLAKQKSLSEDLRALYRCANAWESNNPLDVGESGTLYRFLKFASWRYKLNKKFILGGTLKNREICDDPDIVNWSLEKLLSLDNKTSQWASASVLMGNNEKIENRPYKLKLSYEALEHWKNQRKKKKCWIPRYDKSIEKQARAYVNFLKTGKIKFEPEHSEDYCFARAFNLMTSEEGRKRFPSIISHETNRIEEMEKSLAEAEKYDNVSSKDHRVIQAVVMRYNENKKRLITFYPYCVNKSWPQFFDFLEYAKTFKS